jgi:hypothetical protein
MVKLAWTYIPSSDFEGEDGEPLPDDAPYDRLAEAGPELSRPLVDSVANSFIYNLKEIRPGSAGRSLWSEPMRYWPHG